jgi:hypothetical protein
VVTRKTRIEDRPQLSECEFQLISACDVANGDPDVSEIQRNFDEIGDAMAEPWID